MAEQLIAYQGRRSGTEAIRGAAIRSGPKHGSAVWHGRIFNSRLSSPNITITSPVEGQELVEGEKILIEASAANSSRIAKVTFFVDGEAVGVDGTAPYNVPYRVPTDTTLLVFEVEAWDMDGKVVAAPSVAVSVVPDPMSGFVGLLDDGYPREVEYTDDEARNLLSARDFDGGLGGE